MKHDYARRKLVSMLAQDFKSYTPNEFARQMLRIIDGATSINLEKTLESVQSLELQKQDVERHLKDANNRIEFLKRELAARPIPPVETVAAKWREDGEPDPHAPHYNQERAKLAMGDLTDDEVANAVFRHGDERPSVHDLMSGKAKPGIVYLTAAKERIRWLSRALVSSVENTKNLEMALRNLQDATRQSDQSVSLSFRSCRAATEFFNWVTGLTKEKV